MLEEQTLFANRYRLVKRLGQGAFSEVWKAEDIKANNMVVALKIYAPDKGMDEDGVKMFSSEFTLVFNVSHKNLLTPSYYDDYNGSPYLVLPFCEKGSAQKQIGKMDEREMAKFLLDVSSALAFLHAQHPPIIHQDIKPDNVLIDATGTYRVTDFGISTNLRSTLRKSVGIGHANDSAGTMAYMGPERFNKNRETVKASDVWSLGATAYELMCGDVPFGDFGGLTQKNGADMPDVTGDYTTSLKQLVLQCLANDTWDRPTAAQVSEICNQYLREGYWNLEKLNKTTSGNNPDPNPHSRPTQRKVDVPDKPVTPTKPKPQPQPKSNPDPTPDTHSPKSIRIIAGIVIAIALIVLAVFLIPNKEERAWKSTVKEGGCTAYTSYLDQYPYGKYASNAKNWLSDYYSDQMTEVTRNTSLALEDLAKTWNDYESSIQRLNELWDEMESIDKATHYFNEEGGLELQSRIYDIRQNTQAGVMEKLNAEETNLRLDPSEGTRKNILVLKFFHGYGIELPTPY